MDRPPAGLTLLVLVVPYLGSCVLVEATTGSDAAPQGGPDVVADTGMCGTQQGYSFRLTQTPDSSRVNA